MLSISSRTLLAGMQRLWALWESMDSMRIARYQVLAVSKDLTYSGVFPAGHSAEPKVKAYGLETFYTSQDRGVIRRWAFK